MKANKFITIALSLVVLVVSSCDRDKSEQLCLDGNFHVVETTFEQAYTAGSGRIIVSETGFEVKTDADWLQAQKDGERAIVLSLSKNESSESRTANVIITKGNKVERVPITQLGVVNVMTLNDIETQRQGGEYFFSTEHMDSTPTITTSAPWITYTLEDKQLKITVAPFATGERDDRTGTISIQAGLFIRTIAVRQIYGVVAYADLIGSYNVDYFVEYNGNNKVRNNGTITIEAKEENKSYTLKGLSVDVTLFFDPQTATLTLKSGQLSGVPNLASNQSVFLAGWGALTPKAEGGAETGLNWGENAGLRGVWNKDFENISFKFDTYGFGSDVRPVLGFFLGEISSNGSVSHKDWYRGQPGSIFIMGDATWTKVK